MCRACKRLSSAERCDVGSGQISRLGTVEVDRSSVGAVGSYIGSVNDCGSVI